MADTGAALLEEIRGRAEALGFTAVGVAGPDARPDLRERLDHALEAGWQDGMDWMAETADRRADPKTLWADTRSIVMLGMNYGPNGNPLDALKAKSNGVISVYAQNRDYHDVVKGKLKDGSQFTTGAAENPTLTIVALAIRQADHIASEMSRGTL